MTVEAFEKELTKLYPHTLSADWDNDGIMVSPDVHAKVGRVLVALDATDDVIKYAAEHGFDTVLVHHPMIFMGVRSVTRESFAGKRIVDAVKYGVSVISMHTRLDAGDGGVNDCLLSSLGFTACEKLDASDMPEIGRVADIPEMTAREFAMLVKEKLGCEAVRLTGDPDKKVHRLGVCSGSGGDLLWDALDRGCDVFLTGECGYNKSEDAAEDGIVTVEAGHFYTENPVCARLASLAEKIAGAETEIYDSNPSVIL